MATSSPASKSSDPHPAGRLLALVVLFRDAGIRWSDDNCLRLGASLAYYAVFSIFPLLLLAVTVIGFVLGESPDTRTRLLDSVATATSPAFKTLFDETLRDMQTHQTARGVGAIVGLVTLIFGASGVFSELQATLNQIWRAPPKSSMSFWWHLVSLVKGKALSFLVVVAAAVTILASLIATAVLSALGARVEGAAPQVIDHALLWSLLEAAASVGFMTLVLATVFRLIPEVRVAWRDVFGGAFVSAVLFTAIKRLFAWYLGHLGSYAAYGAVGVFLGLLTWIYVASLMIFYGAEFARVYAERYGSLAASPSRSPGGGDETISPS